MHRSPVWFLIGHCCTATLDKLYLLSPSNIIWYWSKGGDAIRLRRWLQVGLVESSGSCRWVYNYCYSQALCHTRWNTSWTFWHRLPKFRVDLHYVCHWVATSSCRKHVNQSATEPFLLLHHEHGTGCRRSSNCCSRRTPFIVIWKHFCFILFTGTMYGLTLWCAPGPLV